MDALRMDSSAGVRSVSLQHDQALALRWSRAVVVARRAASPSRTSLPAPVDVCRTCGQAMRARVAPAATLPDHTHTLLQHTTLGRRHPGGPGATADGA